VEVSDLNSRNGVYLNGVRIATTTLVGRTALARHRRIAGLVGPTDLAVLITGETGTGKEVLARWLLELSVRGRARRGLGFRRATSTAPVPSEAEELSRTALDELLRRHAGNLRRTGQKLGIARTRLYRWMKRWSLDPAEYRSGTHAASPGSDS
jgi:DNA-binding NtrC family response regulator